MVSVLIVDDSAFMRSALKSILKKDPEIEVIGTACNGKEGVELAQKLNPDVVTMDIEMPVMDGITALQEIMKTSPRPVLIVSSLSEDNAEITLRAMDLGALDYIPKYIQGASNLDFQNLEKEIALKIKSIAKKKFLLRTSKFASSHASSATNSNSNKVSTLIPRTYYPTPVAKNSILTKDIVAIGVSTGGPPAVQKVLTALPEDFPCGIVIAQHMPGSFTGAFATRLDHLSKITVKEAQTGDIITPGVAYVGPGGKHMRIDAKGGKSVITITTEPTSEIYKPSANVLFQSAANVYGKKSLAVIMTGMGSDGTEGLKVLKKAGGKIIAQSEATCVVYGMPKSAVDNGLADEIVDIDNIANAIMCGIYS